MATHLGTSVELVTPRPLKSSPATLELLEQLSVHPTHGSRDQPQIATVMGATSQDALCKNPYSGQRELIRLTVTGAFRPNRGTNEMHM